MVFHVFSYHFMHFILPHLLTNYNFMQEYIQWKVFLSIILFFSFIIFSSKLHKTSLIENFEYKFLLLYFKYIF